MDPLDSMPTSFAAGTTLKLRRSLADYPASDGWTYGLYLRGVGTLDVDEEDIEADGSYFVVTIAAEATAALAPGLYRWVERVEKDDEVFDAATGVVTVTRNLVAATAGQAQTHEERTLALIEAAIENRIPEGMESYQIQGRMVSKIPTKDLFELRGLYRSIVWQQQNPGKVIGAATVVFRDR